MHVPAALIALPILTGSAASILLADSFDPAFAFLSACAAVVGLAAAAGALLLEDLRQGAAALVLTALLTGLSLGATDARRAYAPPLLDRYATLPADVAVHLEGVLREDAALTAFGASLILDVLSIDGPDAGAGALGGVRLAVAGALLAGRVGEWRAGRTIRVPATLRKPPVYLNPGVRDEERALARRGIVLVGSVKSGALVEVIRKGPPVSEAAASVRAWTRRQVSGLMDPLDPKSAGVTTAVLIGDRTGLAREDERRMQEAGTFHVIAISGGNIAILAVLILLACRLVLMRTDVAAMVTAALLIFYGSVAAGAPSVARAVTVAVIALAGRAMDHRGPALNVLAATAALAVAGAPVVVFDPGFILSFGATLGILLGVPLMVSTGAPPHGGSALRGAARRLFQALAALFAATACAEIALAPIGASLFSRVPFAGLLLNFAAIPLMTVVQVGGLALLALSSWWSAGAYAGAWIAHHGATGLLQSARLVDVAPWLSVPVAPPAAWLVAAYYACALLLIRPRLRRPAAWALGTTAVVILAGGHAVARDAVPLSAAPLRVTVLDVGQGDATLVSLPGGRALLVDAAGVGPPTPSDGSPEPQAGFDIGERVVIPSLTALGVTRLDGLVITHADPDHILGMRGVMRLRPVTSIWEGIPVPPVMDLRILADAARSRATTWRTVQAGDSERFDNVEVRVLHPPPADWERQRVRNEDSVVLEIRIGGVSVILPGDIGAEGERAIIPRLEPGRLVVLKAPHHGSATSSTRAMLDVLRPAAVIFSCGRSNRFGHPHPAVVARYEALGTEMFSTAEDGAVFVETDGKTVEVRGWTGRRRTFSLDP